MTAPMDYEQATIAVSRLGLDNDAVEREAEKLIESMEKKGTTIKDSRQIMMNLKTQYKDTANVAESLSLIFWKKEPTLLQNC